MSQTFLNNRNSILKLGGFTVAALFFVAQVGAQNTENAAAAGGAVQPNESSVLLPPQTPSMQANQSQATNQQIARPTDAALTPPQPPREDNSMQTGGRSAGGAQLGIFVVATNGAGVRINSVTPGTAAEAAGLQVGDIILAMNGKAVTVPEDVIQTVRGMNVGDALDLRIWRNGSEQNLSTTLQAMRPTVVQSEYSVPATGIIEGGIVQPYYSYPVGPTYRYYGSYPGTYYAPYGYGYYGRRWGYPYGAPGFGYYASPWGGQGVRIGSFGFGWR